MRLLTLAFMGFVSIHASTLYAGVVITSTQEDLQAKKAPSQIKVYLESDRTRMEVSGERQTTIIYRKDLDLMWIIDTQEKNYTEMTGRDIAEFGSKISEARKKMQDQLKNLPPDQRAMAESMMKGMMGSAEPTVPKLEFRAGKGKDKVGAWSCSAYESWMDGVKSADLCVAPFSAVKVEKKDFEVLKEMGNFMGKINPSLKNAMSAGLNFEQLPGIPVRTISLDAGKPNDKVTLTGVTHMNLAATLFEMPTGFTKKALPKMEENPSK